MWKEQRYCGQLQTHVWIANFRGVNWKTSILWEFLYFFMVLWHGRSCEEMYGAILWVGKQDDSTTLQSIYSMHRWPTLQRGRIEICGRIVASMLSNSLKCLYLARIERPDIQWSVNKLARSITKWTKACDKRIDWCLTFITLVNTNNIVMWATLQNNAGWDCFKTPILREILRTRNPLLVEHFAFLEVLHLFQLVGCVRSKLQFHTVQQNPKSSLWTLDWDKTGFPLSICAIWLFCPWKHNAVARNVQCFQ